MTAGVLKTQGTEVFVLDPSAAQPAILKIVAPTGFSGLGAGTKSQIPTTDLDSKIDESSVPGLGSPGASSVPFNFVPTAPSHRGILTTLKDQAGLIQFVVGFSDGDAEPTVGADDVLVAPVQRTSASFWGYINEVTIEASTNALVTGTMSIQRSGPVTWNFKQ